MAYRVEIITSAAEEIRKLETKTQKRVGRKIEQLKENPRPAGCNKLKGGDELYRVRVGDFRIIYQINDRVFLVIVVKFGDRKDCYD